MPVKKNARARVECGRRHGLDARMAAEAAARNALALGDDRLTALTEAVIVSGFDLNRQMRRSMKGPPQSRRARGKPGLLSTEIRPELEAHIAYVRGALAPSGNDDVLVCADEYWFDNGAEAHARALDRLRRDQPALYRAIVRGHLRTAAQLLRASDPAGSGLWQLLRQQARLSLISQAHQKVRDLRRLAIEPYGACFAGFTLWKTVAHVTLATIAGPAGIVRRLGRACVEPSLNVTDQELWSQLTRRGLLPAEEYGRRVFNIALSVRARYGSPDLAAAVADRMQHAVAAAAPAAAINSAMLADAGLSRRSFVEAKFGFSASEAAALIATELLEAFGEVEIEVARLRGNLCAAPSRVLISDRRIAFAAAILRCEGQPDKEAAGLGGVRGGDGGLDPYNHSSRKPLRALKLKLDADPILKARAKRKLGIDIAELFNR